MDHYEVLKVSKDASSDEIKKSYQKLILQYHPDKVNSFVKITAKSLIQILIVECHQRFRELVSKD